VATSTSLLGSFTCRKFTAWDRWLYFPSKGRCAEDFFAPKIRWLWPGSKPQTQVQDNFNPLPALTHQSVVDLNAACRSKCTEAYWLFSS